MKTIFGEKDTPNVQNDMKEVEIRQHLWLQPSESGRRDFVMLHAPYVLKDNERREFVEVIKKMKTPTNYGSALRKRVLVDGKMRGLKSHDYHVMMQDMLPLCLRHLLDKGPRMAIMKLSRVFKKICSRVVDPAQMVSLKEDTALVLCLLEKEFPPSFFDPMTHLLIHLVEELEICGPVHSRWMYTVERYMKFLKGFVRNMARPEGSMAEGYVL